MKTANINVRIDPEVKSNAERVFSSFGITVTDAINIFLHKAIMEGGLPFDMKQPRYSFETENEMEEARLIMEGKIKSNHYRNAKDLIDEINAEDDIWCWNL